MFNVNDINLEEKINRFSKNCNELHRPLRRTLYNLYVDFLSVLNTCNLDKLTENIKQFTFMPEYIEEILLTFSEFAINTFYDMVAPGYVEDSISLLLKNDKYKEFILLTCSLIEEIMYVDLKRLLDSKDFSNDNENLFNTLTEKDKKNGITLNNYIQLTYFIKGKKFKFVEDFYQTDQKAFSIVFEKTNMNLRNFYSHGNNKQYPHDKIDAYIVLAVYANMIGKDYVEQYICDRASSL